MVHSRAGRAFDHQLARLARGPGWVAVLVGELKGRRLARDGGVILDMGRRRRA